MGLRKIDIAKNLSSKALISKSLSLEFLDNFIDIIKKNSEVSNVKIPGFGTFTTKVTPQRLGRNPNTGQEFIISERLKLKFNPSNNIKSIIN
jgi:nucleoid DNA-binding protein